jgi:hypothetical protein
MDDARVKTVFEKETCRMVRGARVLLKGVWFGNLYKIQGSTINDGCNNFVFTKIGAEEEKNSTIFEENNMLWHQRLGHIREKGLRLLHGKGMVEGMSNFSLYFNFYEHCIYGKKNQVRFPSGALRAEGILQLVHNDVFELASIPSLGKYVYYVSFINDFLGNTWMYFVWKKYKLIDRFKEFKDLMENQTKKIIKVLRMDNGGEFYKNEFEEFYKKRDIERKKTTPYTTQHNGVA